MYQILFYPTLTLPCQRFILFFPPLRGDRGGYKERELNFLVSPPVAHFGDQKDRTGFVRGLKTKRDALENVSQKSSNSAKNTVTL
jgi:hypothetical protein